MIHYLLSIAVIAWLWWGSSTIPVPISISTVSSLIVSWSITTIIALIRIFTIRIRATVATAPINSFSAQWTTVTSTSITASDCSKSTEKLRDCHVFVDIENIHTHMNGFTTGEVWRGLFSISFRCYDRERENQLVAIKQCSVFLLYTNKIWFKFFFYVICTFWFCFFC